MPHDIKIFISCHKECYVPNHPFLYPVQVGADLEMRSFVGMRSDNTGENISSLNRRYCELTAQYWAWKNENADYYGFFHYRRYFSFTNKISRPYVILSQPDDATLQSHGFDQKNMKDIIRRFDIIMPLPENMFISAYKHYEQAKHHKIEDLKTVREIIRERYPDFNEAAEEYLNCSKLFFGNMLIMKKELFNDYCNWLFDILKEFDNRRDFSQYNSKELRVNGYLGERLLGIYYSWLKQSKTIEIGYLPRIHFEAFSGETDNFSRMRKVYKILPPGTLRRSIVKKIYKFLC